MNTKRNRKGVYIDVNFEDWAAFKLVCQLRGRMISETVTDILEPEVRRCKAYIDSIPDFEGILFREGEAR